MGVERRLSVCGSDRLSLEAPAACWSGWLSNEASTDRNRVALWLERGVDQFHQECPARRPTVELGGSFMSVTIGIDPHKSTHTAVAVDRDEHQIARLQDTQLRSIGAPRWPKGLRRSAPRVLARWSSIRGPGAAGWMAVFEGCESSVVAHGPLLRRDGTQWRAVIQPIGVGVPGRCLRLRPSDVGRRV